MRVLAIHTAEPACDLAVLEHGHVLAERFEPMVRGQDAHLPRLSQEVLAAARVDLQALDRIAVVTGPGSFTGIRVGTAFARGLALAIGKPCLGVTAMEAALPAGQQGSAMVALPAQRRLPDVTFWTQTFRTGAATGPADEMPLADLTALLRDRPHMLFGDETALAAHFPDFKIHEAKPTARRAGQVAGLMRPDERTAQPTYVRAPDAALPQPKHRK
ncbi:MAG: tRNA (adenosine(37)-N6)-threonylcarbamoyltransferase complex dimerization subunit type 1 TsaB [Pseudomonadota bacterium]